ARQLRQQGDTGLTPSQMSALTSIDRHGPLTLGALAEREGVAPPSITRVVGKLEEAGLVERGADPADGRVTIVTATAAGRDLLARTRKRKDVWLATRLAELDAGDRRRLAGALDALDRLTGCDRPSPGCASRPATRSRPSSTATSGCSSSARASPRSATGCPSSR